MKEIQFDDIEALKAEISEEFGPWSETAQITQEMINQFAELTGDHQWIHVDVERAKKESPFGGPVAHGFLTLSMLPGMKQTTSAYQLVGFASAANYGSDGLRFLDAVPAGCKIHSRSRLVNVEAKPKGTLLTNEIAIHVVGNERPALVYKMLALYRPPLG